MKAMILFSLLLCLAAAPVQVAAPQNARAYLSGDTDDEGVLPLTLPTPWGQATLLVHESGLALFTIPSIGFAQFGLLPALQLPPGMEGATVDGGHCVTITSGGMSPHTGPVCVLTKPIGPIHGNTLGSAAKNYAKALKEAALLGKVGPCLPAQG